ncbi:hypothetical protein LAZ67_15000933, partial [Cordylochernes scorpioides]
MPRRKICAHYEHMSEFETGRAIGLKEACLSNRLISRHLCRGDAAIRRCWQKWVNNGRCNVRTAAVDQGQQQNGRTEQLSEWLSQHRNPLCYLACRLPHLRIVQKRMEAGQSQVEVAKWLNVNKSVVSKIWKQFIETGTIKRKEGSGRKRKTATSEDRYLVVTAKRHREMTAIQLSNELSSATGTRISRQTVYRRLHEGALYSRRPMVCIPLTSAHRRARLNWCLEHHAWTHDQWANVLFSDESRFSLNTDSRRVFIWREPGTRYHPSNIRGIDSFRGGSFLVWAGISFSRRTPLHIFSGGTLTAQRYRDEILEPYLRPYKDQIGHNFILMDDNARPHRARLINEYLQSENIRRMDWPARSPDLNPIEHVWDALGRRIGARHPSPRTLVELRTALLEEWGLRPPPKP